MKLLGTIDTTKTMQSGNVDVNPSLDSNQVCLSWQVSTLLSHDVQDEDDAPQFRAHRDRDRVINLVGRFVNPFTRQKVTDEDQRGSLRANTKRTKKCG